MAPSWGRYGALPRQQSVDNERTLTEPQNGGSWRRLAPAAALVVLGLGLAALTQIHSASAPTTSSSLAGVQAQQPLQQPHDTVSDGPNKKGPSPRSSGSSSTLTPRSTSSSTGSLVMDVSPGSAFPPNAQLHLVASAEQSVIVRVSTTAGDNATATVIELQEVVVPADSRQSLDVYRLRPGTDYLAEAFNHAGELVASATFATGPTGISQFDNGAFGDIQSGEFSYDVLVTERKFDGFNGYVGMDRFGSVVWGVNMTEDVYTSHIKDLPSHAVGRFSDGSFALLSQGSYQLSRVDASATTQGSVHQPAGYSTGTDSCVVLTHECFVTEDDTVITLEAYMKTFGKRNYWGQRVLEWEPTTNSANTLADLFDYFDPTDSSLYWLDESFNGELDCDQDGTYGKYTVVDYLHANSVARLSTGDLLISARGPSAIIVIDPTTGEQKWSLSSTAALSDFTFADDADKFYNQHYARLLDNGNLLLMDNGNTRPGKSEYSRAVEYTLDMDAMTVTKVWEFAPGGVYTPEGGSIDVLPNGNRVVTFPFIEEESPGGGPEPASAVYEVDSSSNTVGYMIVPWLSGNPTQSAPTRAYATTDINGEVSVV